MESDPATFRRTQRAPKSCVQCTKRKIRCSRTVPCSQCVGRSEGHACRREVVLVKGRELQGVEDNIPSGPITVESLMEENRLLKLQVADLTSGGQETSARVPRDAIPAKAGVEQGKEITNDLEKMAEIMMLLEMGKSRQLDDDEILPSDFPKPQAAFTSSLPRLSDPPTLPPNIPNDLSVHLVTYAVTVLDPIYGTIHGPSFIREHQEYLQNRGIEGPFCTRSAWLAFYHSQLALSIHHMSDDIASSWGIRDRSLLSSLWFNTALQLLWWSEFMSNPDIMTLHTICSLSCLFHIHGSPLLGTTLVAIGVRIGETLRINHIDEELFCGDYVNGTSHPCAAHGILEAHFDMSPRFAEREIRRRLWWNILYRDWLTLPSGFPYVVAAEAILAANPLNLSDTDLATAGPIFPPSMTTPTSASFHIARTRVAKLTHQFFIAYRPLRRDDPKRWELVIDTDKSLSSVLSDMPLFDEQYDNSQIPSNLASWLPIAQNLIRSLVNHKRLLLFRDHFAMAFTDSAYSRARDECVARALNIVNISRQRPSSPIKTPEVTSHCLAAANVLALDLVYTPSSREWSPSERAARAAEIETIISDIKISESLDSHTSKIVGQVEGLLYLDDFLRNGARYEDHGPQLPAVATQDTLQLPLMDDMYSAFLNDIDMEAESNRLWP